MEKDDYKLYVSASAHPISGESAEAHHDLLHPARVMSQRASEGWTAVQITTFEHFQRLLKVIQERLDVLGCAGNSLLLIRLTSVNLTTSKITSLRLLSVEPEAVDSSFMALSRLVQSHRVILKQSKEFQEAADLVASLHCKAIDWEGPSDDDNCMGNTLPFHMYMEYSGPQSRSSSPHGGDLLSALRRIKDKAMTSPSDPQPKKAPRSKIDEKVV